MLLPVVLLHAGTASADTAPSPQPRTVEKGGGIGRMFAWTTLLGGIAGGLASGGVVLLTQQQLSACQEGTVLGLGCAEEQQQADDAMQIGTIGGAAAGAMLVTSIVLFVATDGKHTEIEYGPPPPPSLPIGGYVATGVMLGGAITAHVMMSNAAGALADPAQHPTPDDTEALTSRYRMTRYAAGGLYGLAAVFGAMSAYQTVRTVQTRRSMETAQVSIAPSSTGAVLSLVGRF